MLRDEIKLVKEIAREIAQEEIAKALKDKFAPKVDESMPSAPLSAAAVKIAVDESAKQALNKKIKKH